MGHLRGLLARGELERELSKRKCHVEKQGGPHGIGNRDGDRVQTHSCWGELNYYREENLWMRLSQDQGGDDAGKGL